MENRFLFSPQSLVIFSWRGDEGSRTLIVRFTRPTLLFPIELHRHREFGGLGGSQTLTRSLQDFYAVGYITSPKLGFKFQVSSFKSIEANLRLQACNLRLIFGGCGWDRT